MMKTLLSCLVLICFQTHAASFDCTKASNGIERLICKDPALGKLDEDIAAAYAAAGTGLDQAMTKRLVRSQRDWLAKRPRATSALTADMNKRLHQLRDARITRNGVKLLQLASATRPMYVLTAAPGTAEYNRWVDAVWESESSDVSPQDAQVARDACAAESNNARGDDCIVESQIHVYTTSVPSPSMVSVSEWTSFDQQAAHPTDEMHHHNWWLSRTGRITPADIFAGDAYKGVIARAAQRYGKDNDIGVDQDAIDSIVDPDAWFLTSEGLRLVGDRYTFHAGRGEVEIRMTWQDLGPALRPDFAAALGLRR